MRRTLVIGAAAVMLAVVAPACSDDSEPSKPGRPSARADVEIRDKALKPAEVAVKAGGTVTWKFDDGNVPHDIQGAIFRSGRKTKGTYRFVFEKAGTSTYHCVVHPDMKGIVRVTA